VGSFSKPSRTRCRDVVAAATEPLKTSPIVVSRWVRFPKRTHRKTSHSKVLNLWQGDGYAQNTPGKRWVRFAETMFLGTLFFHKVRFKSTPSSLALLASLKSGRTFRPMLSLFQRTIPTIPISPHRVQQKLSFNDICETPGCRPQAEFHGVKIDGAESDETPLSSAANAPMTCRWRNPHAVGFGVAASLCRGVFRQSTKRNIMRLTAVFFYEAHYIAHNERRKYGEFVALLLAPIALAKADPPPEPDESAIARRATEDRRGRGGFRALRYCRARGPRAVVRP
jgi:hypothetical protein